MGADREASSEAAPKPRSDTPSPRSLRREVLVASIGILAFLTIVKHLAAVVPFVGEHAFTIAAGVQLYVPILLIGRRGLTLEAIGLHAKTHRRDLKIVLWLSLATIVPFAVGHHFWQLVVFHREFAFRLPSGLLIGAATQVLVVALPEELFFRGYLQGRMERVWPAGRRLFGVPFGRATITAAAVFALGHFLGEYRPDRLGPFFPALLFGLLRTKTSSVLAPTLYHAFCNVLSDVLFASYRPG